MADQITDTINALAAAAGTGEILTIVYNGGHAPGFKREIVVLAVVGGNVRARETTRGVPRTYLIEHVLVVPKDHPAKHLSSKKAASAVDPAGYFAGWAYNIAYNTHLHPALGIYRRTVVDRAKTANAREESIKKGWASPSEAKRIKITRIESAIANPPKYCFRTGDTFHRGIDGGTDWVQVVGNILLDGVHHVEAHWPNDGKRYGYWLLPEELAECLMTGVRPGVDKMILPSSSISPAMQYLLGYESGAGAARGEALRITDPTAEEELSVYASSE